MKPIDTLLKRIPDLNPIEFAGLARTLGVKLIDIPKEGDPTPRDFTDVLDDTLAAFQRANRQTKREILQLVKAGEKNARNSKDS